jgi:PucR family transcriptional regulator, purine catabolism regulatory protein
MVAGRPERFRRTRAQRTTPTSAEGARPGEQDTDRRLLEAQNALLKQLISVYDQMTAMVLQGADIGAVTRLLAQMIVRPVLVFNALLQPLASASPEGEATQDADGQPRWVPGERQIAQILENLADGRRPVRIPPMPGLEVAAGVIVAPILAGDDTLGYLTIFELPETSDSSSLDLLVAQHAATVYALTLTRERLSADVANRLREDLLEGLLLGELSDPMETERRAGLLGYESSRDYRVLIVRPEMGSGVDDLTARRRVLESTVELAGRIARDAIAVRRSEEVVILAPEIIDGRQPLVNPAVDLGRAIFERMRYPFPGITLTAAVSAPCRDLAQLPSTYAQAKRTLAAAKQFGREGQITTFEELGIYRLLFQVPNASELRRFADQVLGTLVEYDLRHESDLLRTLAAYLRHHGRLQSAARDLVVHVNTVTYRLQRIREVAGLDLDDAEDRLTAQVALKIYEGMVRG